MSDEDKTHYRKAFNSPYLSSQDIVGPTILTVKEVRLEKDKSKKTKDDFNTAYFREREIRPGEALKPMILNATNSRTMKDLTGSHFIEDWNDIPVTIYVDKNVKFGRETMEGLRISPQPPATVKPELTQDNPKAWKRAIEVYRDTGSFENVLKYMDISPVNQELIKAEAQNVA